MKPSKIYNIILTLVSITLFSNSTAFSQDLDNYSEIWDADNFDMIVLRAENYWSKIENEAKVDNEEYKGYIRWKSFMKPRIGSNGNMEDYGIAINKYYSKPKMGNLKSLGPSTSFEYLGPKGIPWTPDYLTPGSTGKGWVNRIVVFKDDTSHILAGTHNAGLWETTDGGDSWQHITKDYPLIKGIKSIAINPMDSNTYYLLTGVEIGGRSLVYSNGIFKSMDAGNTWNEVQMDLNDTIYYPSAKGYNYPQKLIIHPSDSSILFLLTDEFIIKSSNTGSSWSLKYSGGSSNFQDIEFDTDSSNIIYTSGSVILKSRDTGETWDSITIDVTGQNSVNRAIIGVQDSFPGKVWFYCDTNISNNGKKLVKYFEGTYSTLHTGSIVGDRTMNCEISPSDSNDIYLGGASFSYKYEADSTPAFRKISYKSLNDSSIIYGPGQWLHADVRDIEVINNGSKDVVYVGHDGGVAWGIDDSDCYGTNDYFCWSQISDDGTDGLYITEFYGLAGTESDADLLIGGTQDLSYFVYDNEVWKHSVYGDGGKSVIDYQDTDYSYVISSFNNYLRRLNNRGITNDGAYFSPISGYLWNPILLNPVNPQTLFFGQEDFIKIYNARSSTSKFDTIVISPDYLEGSISAIGISEADTSTIYVACTKIPWSSNYSDSIMWRSDDYGTTWVPVNFHDSIKNIFGWSYVTDITVNPDNEDELWICFGNTNHESKKVYHSADSGVSWNVLKTGYPEDIPAHCIEYDENTELLYIGTDVGLYYWDTDDPSSWIKVDDEMNTIISDIVINKTFGKLRIATYGSGIWETNLPMCQEIGSDQTVTSDWTISDTRTLCSNIIIDGATITVTGTVYMEHSRTITVKNNSTLKISGGTGYYADIVVESGGELIIENNGKLVLDEDDDVSIESGGIFDYSYGSIETR